MSILEATHAIDYTLPSWSAAEFLDTPCGRGLLLRAVICRLAPGRWQWSIMAIENDRGELIALGTERSVAEARQTAASEIDKCLHDPLTLD
jgi:hypothetical protein